MSECDSGARRAPATTLPRRVSSPVLLTRLLKCGDCGGAMTLTTGKSGKYRYYKCTTRVNKGGTLCTSRNLSMERVDNLVLQQLTAHAFTPKRLGVATAGSPPPDTGPEIGGAARSGTPPG